MVGTIFSVLSVDFWRSHSKVICFKITLDVQLILFLVRKNLLTVLVNVNGSLTHMAGQAQKHACERGS